MKPPRGTFPWGGCGKCLLALTRPPLRRPGQPKAAVPDSCIRAASAPDERSYIHGKPMAETGQSYFPGHSAMRARLPATVAGYRWVGGCVGAWVRALGAAGLPDVLKRAIQWVRTH